MTELATTPEQALAEHMREKRDCIASFMDAHPDVFPRPTTHDSWSTFADQLNDTPDQPMQPPEADQEVIQQAIARLGMIIRTAQDRSQPELDMDQLLDQVQEEGLGQIESDPRVLEIASQDASPEEIRTLARAVSLYKDAIRNDIADGTELRETIEKTFDQLPAETPFMRSLVDTARQLVLIDLDYTMRQI
jgi:hypothetical protein